MPLPASGSIALSAIATEFGGAAPHAITEYYRGGANVPNTAANAAIPLSGSIKLTDFYGGSAYVPPDLIDQTVSSIGTAQAAATSAVALTLAGEQQRSIGGGALTTVNTWLNTGAASDYDVRMTLNSSSNGTAFGTFGTWLNMGSTRQWSFRADTQGTPATLSATMELRRVSTLAVEATAAITLSSDWTF